MASTDLDIPEQLELLTVTTSKEPENYTENEKKAYNSVSKDVTCGLWIFKGPLLQKFANETAYIILYGTMGALISMGYAYSNGTISTMEKRFKIPSRISGIISVGNDISQVIGAIFIGYYGGRGHRPRWMGFGLLSFVAFCLLTALPHWLYGAGENALKLTKEFGGVNSTQTFHKQKSLCSEEPSTCLNEEYGNLLPPILLFVAQVISGIGSAIFYTLGVSYMDDNTKRSKAAAMLSYSTFLRMLGPACGYALVSYCLRIFIEPNLTPLINDSDPRWLGAWWLGWIILAIATLLCSVLIAMFPKELPSTRARRLGSLSEETHTQPSTKEMLKTIKRLLNNKIFIFNNLGSTFYFFGYIVYWMYLPKYIEVQYRQSAANSSMVNGSLAFAFSAAGVLTSGFVLSKFKPSGRVVVLWNTMVDLLTVGCCLGYVIIGCPGTDIMSTSTSTDLMQCSVGCHCDYVQYSPVCGQDNVTYISPCHAGCTSTTADMFGKKIYENCKCIGDIDEGLDMFNKTLSNTAQDGACPVDCFNKFVIFLIIMCFVKFLGASARSTNLLISLRCVSAKDKTFAMGIGMMLISMFALVPAPIFYGWLMDRACLVWGKNCSSKGNCWLYDTKAMRYSTNTTAAAIIFIGVLCNIVVFCYSKDLKIFEEDNTKETDKKEKKSLDQTKEGSI